jgi:superfamily II DNA or RNA helicase
MNTNGYQLHNFFKKLGVGVKIYDESHLNFGNILLIDFFSNTARTWYLTATFDRSDKTESRCFKLAFQNVMTFGEMESDSNSRKHVLYHVININSRITPKNRAKLLAYPGFTSPKYSKYAFFDDFRDTMYRAIVSVIDKVKDVDGKILIFIPTINSCEKVYDKLRKDCPDKTFALYHSKVSADEKESALKKDCIISTIGSLGTGTDIKDLRVVINASPYASKVTAQQVMGRLREYAPDKDTFFFDIVDRCINQCNWYLNARLRKITSLAKKVIYLDLYD